MVNSFAKNQQVSTVSAKILSITAGFHFGYPED